MDGVDSAILGTNAGFITFGILKSLLGEETKLAIPSAAAILC